MPIAGFTYDLGTTVGRARLLIPDRDPEHAVWTDEELAGFVAVEGDDAYLVAAAALEAMASDVAYTRGDVRVEDVQTNGSKTSDALLKRAQMLRERSSLADAEAGDAWDWAEMVTDPFTARERLIDQRLRGVV